MKRPDLTPILATLRPNDWIIVTENENGIIESHEGKFRLFTKDNLHMYIVKGNCIFDGEYLIKLENIISITKGESKCDDFIVKE